MKTIVISKHDVALKQAKLNSLVGEGYIDGAAPANFNSVALKR